MFGYNFYYCFSMVFVVLWTGVKSSEDFYGSGQLQEQTIIVPKRAALLLDRIMIALQRVLDEDEKGNIEQKSNVYYVNQPSLTSASMNSVIQRGRIPFKNTEDNNIIPRGMMLYRRATDKLGYPKGAGGYNVWQCYFNVITCFRRKK